MEACGTYFQMQCAFNIAYVDIETEASHVKRISKHYFPMAASCSKGRHSISRTLYAAEKLEELY
eukprot:scaffold360_cov374-Pavlova_lutheri.AAC.24